jgi:NTP pyrophosphatase (non-canonical NTP hydrolase)
MLSFGILRKANIERLPQFKNAKGDYMHSELDGSDWSIGDWTMAVVGELGEAANILKKVRRGDISLQDARPELAKEFADTVTYLDLLAHRVGIDLGEATRLKFNEVSKRVGADIYISAFNNVVSCCPKD